MSLPPQKSLQSRGVAVAFCASGQGSASWPYGGHFPGLSPSWWNVSGHTELAQIALPPPSHVASGTSHPRFPGLSFSIGTVQMRVSAQCLAQGTPGSLWGHGNWPFMLKSLGLG